MLDLRSPAKINPSLKVVGRRPDGYHSIETKLQAVGLYDKVRLELADRDILTIDDQTLPTDNTNLVLRAAELFRKRSGRQVFIRADLSKSIPHQAGLGGGSGNAATTLWGINRLLGEPYSEEVLQEWSSEMGSDIPFFFSHGTAFCTGRGEVVKPLPVEPGRSLWIVKPSISLSTPEVYACLKPGEGGGRNDLEQAAFLLSAELRHLKRQLLSQGFETVVLCGSGSAFYCEGNRGEPCPDGVRTWRVETVSRRPGMWY